MASVIDGEIIDETAGLVLRRVVVGPLETNCWIVHAVDSPACLVVDPGDEPDRIVDAASGLEVQGMVITHGHWDHVLAAAALGEAWGVTPQMHGSDRQLLDLQRERIGDLDTQPVEHGATSAVGSLGVSVVHTPGHTPGSICLRVSGHVLSGDTLFPGGPGSTQGPLADFPSIIRSVGEELFELPDDVQVHPGHGHSTRIGDERPHLDEWIERGW